MCFILYVLYACLIPIPQGIISPSTNRCNWCETDCTLIDTGIYDMQWIYCYPCLHTYLYVKVYYVCIPTMWEGNSLCILEIGVVLFIYLQFESNPAVSMIWGTKRIQARWGMWGSSCWWHRVLTGINISIFFSVLMVMTARQRTGKFVILSWNYVPTYIRLLYQNWQRFSFTECHP